MAEGARRPPRRGSRPRWDQFHPAAQSFKFEFGAICQVQLSHPGLEQNPSTVFLSTFIKVTKRKVRNGWFSED